MHDRCLDADKPVATSPLPAIMTAIKGNGKTMTKEKNEGKMMGLFSCPWTYAVIVTIVAFILAAYGAQKTPMPVASRSLLYEKTKQIVDDFYVKLDKEQLTPWSFFNIGKGSVEKYYGGTIYFSGEFSGSKRMIFWKGYIEPFLEHGITEILEQVAADALAKQLNPEPCISEAAGLLDGVISKTYNCMAEIDQKLRGKGYPKSVNREDVTKQIEKMRNYLQRHKEAVSKIAASKYQYFLNVESRQNKNLLIAMIALGTSIMSALIALVALFKK